MKSKTLIALYFLSFSFTTHASSLSQSVKMQMAESMISESKIYQSYLLNSETKIDAEKMVRDVSIALENKSKAILFCGEIGAGLLIANGKGLACEVMDIKGWWKADFHFLWAYTYSVGLSMGARDTKLLEGAFKTLAENGPKGTSGSPLTLAIAGGISTGYIWGEGYKDYKSLTLESGFSGFMAEVAQGWGAGFKYLSSTLDLIGTGEGIQNTKNIPSIKLAIGSLLIGDSIQIGGVLKFKFIAP